MTSKCHIAFSPTVLTNQISSQISTWDSYFSGCFSSEIMKYCQLLTCLFITHNLGKYRIILPICRIPDNIGCGIAVDFVWDTQWNYKHIPIIIVLFKIHHHHWVWKVGTTKVMYNNLVLTMNAASPNGDLEYHNSPSILDPPNICFHLHKYIQINLAHVNRMRKFYCHGRLFHLYKVRTV